MQPNGVRAVAPAQEVRQWNREIGLGATFVERGLADGTVEHLSRFGIVSEVVEDGRYWRVKVYPRLPEGAH